MATPMVLTASYLALNSTDVSAYASKIELTAEVEEKDVTTFGSSGWKTLLGGIKSGQIAVDFVNDVTAGDLDSILWPLFGTVVTFEVRAANTTVTTSNPKYTGSVLIKTLMPVAGAVGDVNAQSITLPTSSTITRATA